ncbi:hypothetical protein BsWGS_25482 [Bradybaena similaris]
MVRETRAVIGWCGLLLVASLVQLMFAAPLDNPDEEVVYTTLNGPGSHIGITRVDIVSGHRERRGVKNETDQWSHHIPYVLDPSYKALGDSVVHTLKRAIQRIMDNVCVTYTDVTDTWDRKQSHWFTQNGFQSNSYINFLLGSGCSATSGSHDGKSAISTYPCQDFVINTHEVFHTLGVIHTQEEPGRDNYMTVNFDNIDPNYFFTYRTNKAAGLLDVAFDPKSVMMYYTQSFSRNGLPTYTPIRDDIFEGGVYAYSDAALFYEVNQMFHCNEEFCNSNQKDCSPGYHTRVKGRCRCVCPAELDPETDCKTLIDSGSHIARWPDTPMVLFTAGENSKCPDGFDPHVGWFTFDGKWSILQKPLPLHFAFHEKTTYITTCTKTTPSHASGIDWDSWPDGGSFCIIKPIGVDCGGDFKQFTVTYQSLAKVFHSGGIGDTTIDGNKTVLRLCCKDTGPDALAFELPNTVPFRTLSVDGCPKIKGMREYEAMIDLYTNFAWASGDVSPSYAIFRDELQLYMCYYQPPEYGCNQHFHLSKDATSVTMTTPGFGLAREPNRRCLYNFTMPANSQIKVTFNTYDPHENDYVLVKRFHKWQEPYRIPYEDWPKQFVSETDYLFMEYWASWENSTNQGIRFTADLILPEDSCYNVSSRGDDYAGNTTVSETFDVCLPWSEAVQCSDFPTDGMTPIWLLLSGNGCRNPGGKLIQPWCYTYRNGSNCNKRFCDVCNVMTPFDVLRNCSQLKSSIPDFCNIAIERHNCFQTCGFQQASTSRATCGPPQLPLHGVTLGPTKSTYQEGEKVVVQCPNDNHNDPGKEMMCTHAGWTHLDSLCVAHDCQDIITTPACEKLLTLYPGFCNDSRLAAAAEYCQRSCGRCQPTNGNSHAIQCIGNSSNSVEVISPGHVVSPGEVMTFACRPGFFLVSGHLERSCSSTGQLLGSEPVCQDHPPPRDVQTSSVYSRRGGSLVKGLAVLFTDPAYRVPFDGKIDRWYYYCDSPGLIYFMVYRPEPSSSHFQYIGSNSVACESGHVRGHYVPKAEQISAHQDDVVGVYSTVYFTLSMNNCTGNTEQLARVIHGPVGTAKDLQHASFPYQSCLYASVGYHIIPS